MTWTERSICLLAETPVLLRRNSTAISVKLRYLFGIISATLRRNATILSIRRRISDGCKPSDSCQKGINLTKTAHFPNVKILSVYRTKFYVTIAAAAPHSLMKMRRFHNTAPMARCRTTNKVA